MDKTDLLLELCNGIIGDQYPSPSRCLACTETILNDYLQSTLYGGADLKGATQVFPTEGGTAAMTYVFQSLSHNRVLKPGDKIAIGTPIFTPYLQIPHVNDYGLVSVDVTSTAQGGWDIAPQELEKLKDPDIKAFFLVNPSNPASHALSNTTLEKLAEIVRSHPDLIILTDDPASMRFIDRMCADSRSIGLSTPSQVFMDLLSLTHLVNKDADPYIAQSRALVA